MSEMCSMFYTLLCCRGAVTAALRDAIDNTAAGISERRAVQRNDYTWLKLIEQGNCYLYLCAKIYQHQAIVRPLDSMLPPLPPPSPLYS